jgi:hypothetical protein
MVVGLDRFRDNGKSRSRSFASLQDDNVVGLDFVLPGMMMLWD